MSGFHGDFLYGMNWRSYIEEKWERMAKSTIFWAKPASGTSTHWHKDIGTGTAPSGIGTDASCNPIFARYALLSLIFVHRLFRDPNKGLMGVQIRMKLSEKRTVPRRYSFNTINCSTTKSGEFVFD